MDENMTFETEQKQSKALEICSLVFGILSITCCSCYGIFGIVGLVLSIVAFSTGKKSGLSVAGLICSIIGIVLTVVVIVVGFNSPYYQEIMNSVTQQIQ